jgi:hypothetical protein
MDQKSVRNNSSSLSAKREKDVMHQIDLLLGEFKQNKEGQNGGSKSLISEINSLMSEYSGESVNLNSTQVNDLIMKGGAKSLKKDEKPKKVKSGTQKKTEKSKSKSGSNGKAKGVKKGKKSDDPKKKTSKNNKSKSESGEPKKKTTKKIKSKSKSEDLKKTTKKIKSKSKSEEPKKKTIKSKSKKSKSGEATMKRTTGKKPINEGFKKNLELSKFLKSKLGDEAKSTGAIKKVASKMLKNHNGDLEAAKNKFNHSDAMNEYKKAVKEMAEKKANKKQKV